MKILMIAPTPFFADRGCHTRIYGEIAALQRAGNEVLLCTYGLGRNIGRINIVRTINFPWYKKLTAGPSVTKILLLPFLTVTVMNSIKNFDPDVVHAHLHEGAVIARVCSLFFKKPLYVFDAQGSLSGEIINHKFVKKNGFLHRFFIYLEKIIDAWFPVITQSENMVKQLLSMNVKPQRIANAMDGVDTEVFKPMPPNNDLAQELGIDLSKPIVLYMGLLEEYQGVDLMFDAFEEIIKKCKNVQFVIIGYPNIQKYKNISKEKGFENNVFFVGKVAFNDTPKYLSLAKIAVAPKISDAEGDGKIYCYMAMAMAVVAFERNVSKEILDDTGIFAAYRDAKNMAEKIVMLLYDDNMRMEFGRKARERVVHSLSYDLSAKLIVDFYKRMENN